MEIANFSAQFSGVWGASAASATITYPIPATTSTSGRASLSVGFAAVNLTQPASGGIPPFGQDFNGIFKMLSTSAQNYEAGTVPTFSSTFATDIGGYPLNAIVADATTAGLYWCSTVDSNMTTPGATEASWQKFGWNQFVKQGWGFSDFGNNALYLGWRTDGTGLGLGVDSTDVGTVALLADVIKQGSSDGSLSTGDQAYIGLRTGITSGAARIGAKIDDTDFGNFAMSGNGTLGMGGWTEEYYTLSSGGSRTISLTFNAPLDGYVLVIGSANYAVQNTNQTNLTISVNGTNLSADQVTGSTSMTNHSCVKVSAGTVTVGSYCGTSATNPPNVGHTLSYIYIPA